MSPREADKLIKSGKKATFHNAHFRETFRGVVVKRDRWSLWIDYGGPALGIFVRSHLEIVKE